MPVIPIVGIIIVFVAGAFIKGWSGFGTNLLVPPLLLILYLSDFPSIVVVITVSVNFILNILILVVNKNLNLKSLDGMHFLIVFAVVFNFIGSYFLKGIDAGAFKVFFGIMIILVTLNRIFKLKFKINNPRKFYIPVGILSGLLNGMAGLGGLPVLILLSSTDMEKNKFKSTLVSYFLVMNLVFIISAIFTGLYSTYVFTNIGIVILFALLSCYIGIYFSKRVSDKHFSTVFNIILILFGINMVYTGLFNEHILLLFQ